MPNGERHATAPGGVGLGVFGTTTTRGVGLGVLLPGVGLGVLPGVGFGVLPGVGFGVLLLTNGVGRGVTFTNGVGLGVEIGRAHV